MLEHNQRDFQTTTTAMMVANRSSKLKVYDKSNNAKKIDGEHALSFKNLVEIQDELEKINEEATDEVLEIKQKYSEVSKPFYDKRNNLINSIPNFWIAMFSIHPGLNSDLNEKDLKIFKHLSSLEVEDYENVKLGYSITFNFNPNPYFEETKIVKSFAFLGEGTTKVTNTPITWKEDKEIPSGISHEKKGNKRPHLDISFFSWSSESEQNGHRDKIYYTIANIIKDDIWPNALNYFNNGDFDEAYEDEDEDESCDVKKDSDGLDDD
jgi:template-activating factor I